MVGAGPERRDNLSLGLWEVVGESASGGMKGISGGIGGHVGPHTRTRDREDVSRAGAIVLASGRVRTRAGAG